MQGMSFRYAALAPISALCGLGMWGLLIGLTKYMSLGSIGAMIALPISYWLDNGEAAFHKYLAVTIFLVVASATVVWSHRENIKRILQGTERRVGSADPKL